MLTAKAVSGPKSSKGVAVISQAEDLVHGYPIAFILNHILLHWNCDAVYVQIVGL